MTQIAEKEVVVDNYRKNMDDLEVGAHFLFPSEKRQSVSNTMSSNFHMKPRHINKKQFTISKVEEDDRYLKLTRVEDFE